MITKERGEQIRLQVDVATRRMGEIAIELRAGDEGVAAGMIEDAVRKMWRAVSILGGAPLIGLWDSETGAWIRVGTDDELRETREAQQRDGAQGSIIVDGRRCRAGICDS